MWFSGLKRTGKWVESSVSTILKLDALLTLMRIYKMEEGRESFTQWVLERQKNFCDYYHKEREGMAVELNCENIKGWVSF